MASATTDANGAYSVKVTDPAAPVGQELDDILRATAVALSDGGDTVLTDLDLDFLRSLTPTRVEILNDQPGLGTTTDGLRPGLNPLALIPGGLGVGGVVAYNSDNVELEDIDVQLTIKEGNFVDITDPFEANPVVGAPVDFSSLGKTMTVNTGDVLGGGVGVAIPGTFLANIERNTGFDDDGLVSDKLTAAAGAATDTHDLTWTTNAVPLNPRASNPLTVELSADQESSILPKARAGTGASAQEVDYDVHTYDQFENPTSQNVDITDDTPIAGFTASGTSEFDLTQPAISAFSPSATDQSLEVELEGPLTTTYFDDPADSSFDPATPLDNIQQLPVVVEQDTDAINWYNAIITPESFVLTQLGPEEVLVGSTVSYSLTGTDQEGQPLNGFGAGFLRVGPGNDNSDDGQLTDFTDANGQAFYDFAGGTPGKANVSAVVYSDKAGNARLFVTPTDTVTFTAQTTDGPRADISPKLLAENGKKFDQLTVRAERAPGALTRFYKKTKKGRQILKSKKLDSDGTVSVRIKDTNGKKRTRYFAIVSKTDINTRAKTNIKKVR